jgi:cholesterol transport system auxiliary component
MTHPLSRRAFAAASLIAAMALSSCTELQSLRRASAPVDLYQLSPKSSFAPDLPHVAAQIVVDEPTAASAVNTDQIAVKPNPYQVQYFPGARWVDRAPVLVQTLLVESIENTEGAESVGRLAIGLTPDYTLVTDLREFQAEVPEDGSSPLIVNVRLNVKIVDEPEGHILASESFDRVLPVASTQMVDVVMAFDDALGSTMRDAAEWSLREIYAFERGQNR